MPSAERGAKGDAEEDACKFILDVTVCTNACKNGLTLCVNFVLVLFRQGFFQGVEELRPFGRQHPPDQI